MTTLPSRSDFNTNYAKFKDIGEIAAPAGKKTMVEQLQIFIDSNAAGEETEREAEREVERMRNIDAIRKFYEPDVEESEQESSQDSGTTDNSASSSQTVTLPEIKKDDIRIEDFYYYILNTKAAMFTHVVKADQFTERLTKDHCKTVELINTLDENLVHPIQRTLHEKVVEIGRLQKQIDEDLKKGKDTSELYNKMIPLDNEITKLKMKIALSTIYMLLAIIKDDPNSSIAFYMGLLHKYSTEHLNGVRNGGNKFKKSRKSRRQTRAHKQTRTRKSRRQTRAHKQKRTRKSIRK